MVFASWFQGTYQQRYWVNGDYWQQPNGPIFLYIGGEGALNSFTVQDGKYRMCSTVMAPYIQHCCTVEPCYHAPHYTHSTFSYRMYSTYSIAPRNIEESFTIQYNSYCKSGNVHVEFNFANFAFFFFNSHESDYILLSTSSDICSTAGPRILTCLVPANMQLAPKCKHKFVRT